MDIVHRKIYRAARKIGRKVLESEVQIIEKKSLEFKN